MAPVPRDTVAGRVFNDLRNTARREGRGTDELLVFYVLERWLYRASISPYADRFILKGGLLLAALDARRPTRDGDLLASLRREDSEVLARVREIAAIEVDDGLRYHVDQVRAETIREDDHYAGLRVTMPASLGSAQVKLALDINFGDPITPGAVRLEYPLLLPGRPFGLLAYPVETVLAEKIVTAVARGETNTRDRDWADLWRLTGTHDVTGAVMTDALHRTAGYRKMMLSPLSERLGRLTELRAVPYRRWRRQQGVDGPAYPEEFADIVREVLVFTEPLLIGRSTHQRWEHQHRQWR